MQLQTSSRIRTRVVEIRHPLGQVCGVCIPARTPTSTKQIGTVQNPSACTAVHSSRRVEVGLKCDVIGRAVSIFRDAKRHQEQLGQGSMQPGERSFVCCLRRAVQNPVCEAVPTFGSAVTYNCIVTLIMIIV